MSIANHSFCFLRKFPSVQIEGSFSERAFSESGRYSQTVDFPTQVGETEDDLQASFGKAAVDAPRESLVENARSEVRSTRTTDRFFSCLNSKVFLTSCLAMSETDKSKGGRPTKYTPELGAQICELFESGLSFRKIEAIPGMPNKNTIRRWREENQEFCVQSARAMEDAADVYEDQRKEITQALIEAGLSGEDLPKGKVEALKAAAQELARTAANHAPKRFGNKIAVGGDADNPLVVKQEPTEGALALWAKLKDIYGKSEQ